MMEVFSYGIGTLIALALFLALAFLLCGTRANCSAST